MSKVVVALDWTPNTNHIGFFVAQSKGFYKNVDLEVDLISPEVDKYERTPRMKVEAGEAMFGVAPSETVISCHTSGDATKPKLVAVAALLQKQTSAIVTRGPSGIDRPKALDGKKYASYQGRFEMDIVRQLIKDDGGEGTVEEVLPGEHGLGIFNTILREEGTYDATWVFMPWEGVIAKRQGVQLNVFSLEGIPYGYTPILLAHPEALRTNPDVVKKFLAATAEGYKYACEHQDEAVMALVEAASHRGIELTEAMLVDSMKELAPSILNPVGKWGTMELERWDAFSSWLFDKDMVKDRAGKTLPRIDPSQLFTNEFNA